MPGIQSMPGVPDGGSRQERAARLRAEMTARQRSTAPGPEDEDPSLAVTAQDVDAADEEGPGPVGAGEHLVKQGECISSIARDTGHFWERIWNDAGNSALREVRKDPNVLLPDDRVTIPEISPKQEAGETEMRHRFVRRGEPAFFRLVFRRDGVPRANEPYIVEAAGQQFSGVLDVNGQMECAIPGNADKAEITLNPGTDQATTHEVKLGEVDPHDRISGVQTRLNNLGFDAGPVDGECGSRTRAALRRFQEKHGLEVTGAANAATQKQLRALHVS